MGMREIRVYEGDFPSFEQMLAGGPAAAFPKEMWLSQVQPGEFAVRSRRVICSIVRPVVLGTPRRKVCTGQRRSIFGKDHKFALVHCIVELRRFPKGMGMPVSLSSFCFRPSQQQQRPYGQGQQQWNVQVQIVQEHIDIQVEGHGNNHRARAFNGISEDEAEKNHGGIGNQQRYRSPPGRPPCVVLVVKSARCLSLTRKLPSEIAFESLRREFTMEVCIARRSSRRLGCWR